MKHSHTPPTPKPLFLERMQKLLPDKTDFQSYLNILKIPSVKSIRCNKLKISPDELKKKLEEKRWKIKQPWKNHPEVMIVKGKIGSLQSHSQIDNIINNKTINIKNSLHHSNKLLKGDCILTKSIAKKSGEADFEANQSANKVSLAEGGRGMMAVGSLNSRGKAEPILIDLEPGEVGRALEHQLGYYYMQELASMLPVIALNPKRDELILDLCAAPGSKTTQLSSEMQGTGTIIANEVSMGRLKILASNLERCGASNTIITRKDGFALCKRLEKFNPEIKFDKILVDAPCSGEGTLRSSFKTYKMWNIKTIQNLPKIQKGLVESAFEILKPNGVLIYSTCTHAPEENEGVVDYILEKFGDEIKLEKVVLPIKTRGGITEWDGNPKISEINKTSNKQKQEGLINSLHSGRVGGGGGDLIKPLKFSKEVKKCARVYPQDNDTEGFFVAKFRRVK